MKRLIYIAFNLCNMKVLAATIVASPGSNKLKIEQHQNEQTIASSVITKSKTISHIKKAP